MAFLHRSIPPIHGNDLVRRFSRMSRPWYPSVVLIFLHLVTFFFCADCRTFWPSLPFALFCLGRLPFFSSTVSQRSLLKILPLTRFEASVRNMPLWTYYAVPPWMRFFLILSSFSVKVRTWFLKIRLWVCSLYFKVHPIQTTAWKLLANIWRYGYFVHNILFRHPVYSFRFLRGSTSVPIKK